MIWLTWRQFRTQATVIAAVLLVMAVPAVITGTQTRHWVAACAASGACLGGPPAALTFMSQFGWVKVLLGGGLLAMPAITGMFFAAPLVAREYDAGTFRLVWTQSVSRLRWLTVKVAVVGAASVLTSGLLSWLTTWWFGPADAANQDKFVDSTFGMRDVAPLGYALFAFGVGLAAGLLLRRVLPAMATTLGVYVAARMVVQMLVRAHYAAPLTKTAPLVGAGAAGDTGIKAATALPPGSWVVSQQIVDASGQPINHPLLMGPDSACAATGSCLAGYQQHLVYQPGSRYWPFQWTEAGLFAAVGLLLVGFCYWWIAGRRVPGRSARGSAIAAHPPVATPGPAVGTLPTPRTDRVVAPRRALAVAPGPHDDAAPEPDEPDAAHG